LVKLLRELAPRGVLLAIALLLVAQQGAQWHAYAHAEARSPDAARQAALLSHGACSDCLGFAPLLAAAGTPAWVPRLKIPLQRSTPSARPFLLLDPILSLAFRSRAPPR